MILGLLGKYGCNIVTQGRDFDGNEVVEIDAPTVVSTFEKRPQLKRDSALLKQINNLDAEQKPI